MNGPFRVVYSEPVRGALKLLLSQASQRHPDLGKRALAAVKTIDDNLHAQARDFGEPLYQARELELTIRIGIVLPMAVSFATHDSRDVVFVTSFRLIE